MFNYDAHAFGCACKWEDLQNGEYLSFSKWVFDNNLLDISLLQLNGDTFCNFDKRNLIGAGCLIGFNSFIINRGCNVMTDCEAGDEILDH
jgi:hypothetical protein